MRRCGRCRVTKDESDFDRRESGVFYRTCRPCRARNKAYYTANRQRAIARARQSQKNNPERVKAYKRAQNRKHPSRYLLRGAKYRAKKYGCPLNISAEDITIPSTCPILGIPLQINDGCCGPNSLSLDRIIPHLGYVQGNIQVISHRANTIKSDATLEELRKVVAYLESLERDV